MTIHNAWPRPNQIHDFYYDSAEALATLRLAAERGAVDNESRFFGMTVEEIGSAFAALEAELKAEVVLLLVASFEAKLQIDLRDRFENKRKDSASKRLCELERDRRKRERRNHRQPSRVPVDKIIKAWRTEVGHPRAFQRFLELIKLRNWLAHGRYWAQKSGIQDIDPLDAWQRGEALFRLLPGVSDGRKITSPHSLAPRGRGQGEGSKRREVILRPFLSPLVALSEST